MYTHKVHTRTGQTVSWFYFIKHDTLDGIYVQLETFWLPYVREKKKKKVHYKRSFKGYTDHKLFRLLPPVHKAVQWARVINPTKQCSQGKEIKHQFWWVSRKTSHGISSPVHTSVELLPAQRCNIKDRTRMQLAWKESSTSSTSTPRGGPTLRRKGHFLSQRSNPAKHSVSQCRSHIPGDSLS